MEREQIEFDVAIVGAGPVGLSAAIRLKAVSPNLSDPSTTMTSNRIALHMLLNKIVDANIHMMLKNTAPSLHYSETLLRSFVCVVYPKAVD